MTDVMVRISAEVKQKAKIQAAKENISIKELTEKAIENYLKKKEKMSLNKK